MFGSQNRLLLLLSLTMSISSAAQPLAIDSIINPGSCRQIVETLAADSFMGRLSTSPRGEQAARFIANEFSKAGCAPGAENTSWFMPFSILFGGANRQAHNVMAILPGKSRSNELLIFSAHYDHIGTKATNPFSFMPDNGHPERNDTVYNGANDNASGTSALILLARYFARAANNERTLVFIAFTGEELGLLGSQYASGIMDHKAIVAMINMDMLGVPISRKKRNPYLTGSAYSNLQTILNNTLYEYSVEEFGKKYFRNDPFGSENLFSRSDNYPFAQKGVPAHTVIATHPRNRFYHSLNDEPATLDYALLAKNIKAIAIGSGTLAAGSQTPTRINTFRISD